jgi:hypothetical protein
MGLCTLLSIERRYVPKGLKPLGILISWSEPYRMAAHFKFTISSVIQGMMDIGKMNNGSNDESSDWMERHRLKYKRVVLLVHDCL